MKCLQKEVSYTVHVHTTMKLQHLAPEITNVRKQRKCCRKGTNIDKELFQKCH